MFGAFFSIATLTSVRLVVLKKAESLFSAPHADVSGPRRASGSCSSPLTHQGAPLQRDHFQTNSSDLSPSSSNASWGSSEPPVSFCL